MRLVAIVRELLGALPLGCPSRSIHALAQVKTTYETDARPNTKRA